MQNDTCSELLDKVTWDDPGLIASLVVLGCIDVMVIVGNCLVIMAVFMSSKLRTVTNLFIVSLAVADLMVGVAVLPFSATWEVFKVWIFGDVWCSIWLAVDVWMCTASILNLCAISLDRYVAVTRPVSYPSIMSSKRAKLLIAGVWILSFVICFPPLVGWNDQNEPLAQGYDGNTSRYNSSSDWNDTGIFLSTYFLTTTTPLPYDNPVDVHCPWICELTNDAGYVVYSALGSFYIPMFVMLFFYWRIYRAAVQTTHAINQGFRTTKGSRVLGNRFEEQRLTLRIHRGRGSVMQHSRGEGRSPGCQRAHSSRRLERSRTQERIKISVSYPPNNGTTSSKKSSSCKTAMYSVHYTANGGRESVVHKREDGKSRNKKDNSKFHLRVSSATRKPSSRKDPAETPLNSSTPLPSPSPTATTAPTSYDAISSSSEDNKPKLISKMGKRNIKAQVKRFRMETKAAKTLGIIVGGFIFCWFPFFTMYLIRAFCPECIHPVVFSVLFWLGYCNSAINPCIYALFSKDFRFAFKKIICKCFCNRRKPPPTGIPNPAIYLSSLGDESDGNNENGSDSR